MRNAAALVLSIVLAAVSTTAFTAPADIVARGEAAAALSGVVVDDVRFTLDPRNASRLATVELSLDRPVSGSVRVALGGASWHACAVAGDRASCATPGWQVAALDELRVIVA